MNEGPRIQRERKTIQAMIKIWCNNKHGTKNSICSNCEDLLNYSKKRLDQCQFGEKKNTCANCTIHCYKSEHREKIKLIMRFSGPKMIYMHPKLALAHLLDGLMYKKIEK